MYHGENIQCVKKHNSHTFPNQSAGGIFSHVSKIATSARAATAASAAPPAHHESFLVPIVHRPISGSFPPQVFLFPMGF
jgi:hypothetical protein